MKKGSFLTEHLRSINKSYFQHLKDALYYGFRLLIGGCPAAVTPPPPVGRRVVCRGSWPCVVVQKWGESAPWFNCGAERRRQSGLDTNKREKNEKEEAGSSASRDSNRNKKKPGGGIEPPQRHQPRALATGAARQAPAHSSQPMHFSIPSG